MKMVHSQYLGAWSETFIMIFEKQAQIIVAWISTFIKFVL